MSDEKPISLQDVARPGTTPASATSKPVIVGHTSMVVDPMTTPEKKEPSTIQTATSGADATKPATASQGSSKPKLAPISGQDIKPEGDPEKGADKPQTVEGPAPSKVSEEDLRQESLAELIESGQYKVSIHSQKVSTSSFSNFVITVLAVVLVGVVVLFVLSDLKILDLGVKLPFHIFKQ